MARPRSVSDDDILLATARVVAREGARRFTLQQVGDACGLTAPALIHRFGGKRQLLLALSERSRREPAQAIARARAQHPALLDALAAGLADAMGPLVTPKDVARSLDYLALDVAEPDFHAHALAFFQALRAEVRRTLLDAREAGELEPKTDLDALARMVEVAFNGGVITWAIHRHDGSLREALRRDVLSVLAPHRARASLLRGVGGGLVG